MSTANKYMQSASGAGGEALNVEDVFSTYLYQGTSANQTITNDIDLDGEGGLVWVKGRPNAGYSHGLYDTERGVTKRLASNETSAESTYANSVTAFNNNGFSLGSDGNGEANYSGSTYASWTFRKAKKFFDVVTYTGNGANRTISHNLGTTPGMIIVKKTNTSGTDWAVYHRGIDSSSPEGYHIRLNTTAARQATTFTWGNTAPTNTTFTVGNSGLTNNNSDTYVAYLFAHNDGDGDFGPDGDADIIKCGSYTNSGSAWSVDLGFEPQFLIRKLADGTGDWQITDTMRGLFPKGQNAKNLRANTSNAENNAAGIQITSTGIEGTGNGASGTWLYIAIRRPTAVPTSATDVFDIDVSTASQPYSVTTSLNYVDATINRVLTSGQAFLHNRLTGSKWMFTDSTNAESDSPNDVKYDFNGKVMPYFYTSGNSHVNYMWKRAPNYFDVVAFTGTGSAGTHNHNLAVPPEMMWVKSRAGNSNWFVYHSGLGATKYLFLNETSAAGTASSVWNDTAPTSSVFSVGASVNQASASIAYLFASLDGVSKLGSVSHTTGSNTDVDCGFSAGARFVILKGANIATGWLVLDTERGIVTGNDPLLQLHSSSAEDSSQDRIDPYSSGFSIGPDIGTGTWIYYAIA
jgi:hypothetical protein